MDRYHIKWTRLQAEIFRFFCIKVGMSFNLREIARNLKKSPTTVSSALLGLEKEGILKIKRAGSMNLFSIEFNRDSKNAIVLKKIENLKMIYESELVDFLKDEFPGVTAVLFGSYSRGEDIFAVESEDYSSDIDIAIIGAKSREINLEKFEKMLERKIIINFYDSFKRIHKHLRDSILNGIILFGSVDL